MKSPLSSLQLCYVRPGHAFFTSQSLEKQWGDDWDDIPYEHNAGDPYDPCWHRHPDHRSDYGFFRERREDGLCACTICERDWDGPEPRWMIIEVLWEGPLRTPADNHYNSPWSVKTINHGKAVPWLTDSVRRIYAGTSLPEFSRLVRDAGGSVTTHVRDLTEYIRWRKRMVDRLPRIERYPDRPFVL